MNKAGVFNSHFIEPQTKFLSGTPKAMWLVLETPFDLGSLCAFSATPHNLYSYQKFSKCKYIQIYSRLPKAFTRISP